MRGRRWLGAGVGALVALLAAVPAAANPRSAPGATWQATATQIPATGDAFLLDGAEGDYLTSGQDHLFLGADQPFRVTLGEVFPGQLRISDADNRFRLWITPPAGQELTTGFYGGVSSWTQQGPPPLGELDLGALGRGCNLLGGWYQIDELDVVDGAVQHVALRFGVRCERQMPTTYGQLRWSAPASAPNVVPPSTVTATAIADGIRADWSASPSPGVSGYDVIATRDGLAVARQHVEGGSTTTATFSGLATGRRHQVVVRPRLEGSIGPRSRPSGSAVAGLVADDPRAVALVEQLYRDVLGRRPDPAGRDYWIDRLQSGAPRSSVTLALVRTPEQRRRAVERLFHQLTARAATRAELDALAPWLVAPGAYDQISALIVGTEERVRDYDRTPWVWADGLFRDVLGATSAGTARDEITEAVAAGASLPGLALPVIQRPEARQRVVEDIYVRMLGRVADGAGRAYWQQQLVGGRSPELVTAALLASPEYAARAAAA